MGLINYLGESKVIKKICELLNVKDVKVNGTSVVDASGDANITISGNTDENVKQSPTVNTNSKYYRVLLSKSDNDTEETSNVQKASSIYHNPSNGYLVLNKQHSETSNQNNVFEIGNNKASGTAGNNAGVVRLYGKGTKYGQFGDADNILTDNRTYGLPNQSGNLVVTQRLSTQDLNDIRTSGFYIGASGNSCANKPSTSPAIQQFGMIVVKSTSSNDVYCTQLLFAPSTEIIWKRSDVNGTWSSWAEVKTIDENVKQISTGLSSSAYRVLLSYSGNSTEETNSIRKLDTFTHNPKGFTYLVRYNDTTSPVGTTFVLGNDKVSGTTGTTYGALRMYGQGSNYTTFYDQYGAITGNRNYLLPNKSGELALRDNITRAKLDNSWNLISAPFYSGNNTSNDITYTITGNEKYTITGTASASTGIIVRRYSENWTLPAGKYRLSGCPSGGSTSTYYMRIGTSEGTSTITWLGSDTGSGVEFTLTEEKIIHCQIQIANGYAIQDSLVYTPTLVRLDGGWVDLGTIDSNLGYIPDVFSEYLIGVEVYYSYNSTTWTRYLNIPIPRVQLGTTEKNFITELGRIDLVSKFFIEFGVQVVTGSGVQFTDKTIIQSTTPDLTLNATPKLYGKI